VQLSRVCDNSGIYLTVTMAMTSLSIMLTVFVLQLHHAGPHQRTVPAWVRTLVVGYVARALCMRSHLGSYYETSATSATAPEAAEAGNGSGETNRRLSFDKYNATNELTTNCRLFGFRRGSKTAAPPSLSTTTMKPIPSVRIDTGQTSTIDSNDIDAESRAQCPSSPRRKRWSSASIASTSRSVAGEDDEKSFRFAYGEPRPSLVDGFLGILGVGGGIGRRRKRSSAVTGPERVIARHLKLYLSRNRAEQDFEDVINEWRLVAHIMDRLLFTLFLIGSVLSTVIILIVMPLLKPTLIDRQSS